MKSLLRSAAANLFGSLSRSNFGGRLNQLIVNSMMSGRHEVVHGNVRLSFVTPNLLNGWRARTFSSKEPETLAWIDSFPEGAVLWDVGANVGLYSCYAAKARRCRVFSFEPSVFNLELLARNVWVNGLSERVTLVPAPLSDKLADSTLNMTTTEWGGAMSTFDKSYTHDGSKLEKVFEYRTIGFSMDDAMQSLGIAQPDYIKMDVDGIEHLILKGGARVLSKVRGLLIEINEDFAQQAADSTRYLRQAGLVLLEKGHAAMFDNSHFEHCYNQIWRRADS